MPMEQLDYRTEHCEEGFKLLLNISWTLNDFHLRVISCIHLSYNTNIWDPLVFVVYSLLYLQNFGGG